jgi:BON domain
MGNRQDDRSSARPGYGPPRPDYRPEGRGEPSAPREGADNAGGYPREGGFTSERGFGHIPGQRWSGGYGGDVERERGREGPPSGRGFAVSDFGPARDMGYGHHGTDLGMGAPPQEHGPHYGKGPKGYKRSDTRIHDDVCDAIADQGFIDATDVEVRVVERIVTLSGTVMHRHEKKGLEHIAEHVRGVDEVHNELRLRRHQGSS